MLPPLRTPRLHLAPLTPDDAERFAVEVMGDEAALRGFPRIAAATPDERLRLVRERWFPAFAEARAGGLANYLPMPRQLW